MKRYWENPHNCKGVTGFAASPSPSIPRSPMRYLLLPTFLLSLATTPTTAGIIVFVDPTAGTSTQAQVTGTGSYTWTGASVGTSNNSGNWLRLPLGSSGWWAPTNNPSSTEGWQSDLTPGGGTNGTKTTVSGGPFTFQQTGPSNITRTYSNVYARSNGGITFNTGSNPDWGPLTTGTYTFTLSGSALIDFGHDDSFWASPGSTMTWQTNAFNSQVMYSVQIGQPQSIIPEPSSFAIFGIGALGMVVRHRRKQKQA